MLRILTSRQLAAVSAEVAVLQARSGVTVIVEGLFAIEVSCPTVAQRIHIHRHGQRLAAQSLQRVLTDVQRLERYAAEWGHKREKWSGQAAVLQDGWTLRTVAKDFGVHVEPPTASWYFLRCCSRKLRLAFRSLTKRCSCCRSGAMYTATEGVANAAVRPPSEVFPPSRFPFWTRAIVPASQRTAYQGNRRDNPGRRLETFRIGRRGAVYLWH